MVQEKGVRAFQVLGTQAEAEQQDGTRYSVVFHTLADMLDQAGELICVGLGIGEGRVFGQESGDVRGRSATCVQDGDLQNQKGPHQIQIARVADDSRRI
ncbi:hypothetical protein [Streptomyces spiralis]|uniref:hypothetical protein n=1 Tax=Streptomyces spiralis TaxID=66376 RepID=UPI003677306E